MALVIPNLGVLIDLIGAVSGSLLAIIIPSYIDLRLRRPEQTPLVRTMNKIFIGGGAIFGILGTALAVGKVVEGFGDAER